jgi:hypothetical protein
VGAPFLLGPGPDRVVAERPGQEAVERAVEGARRTERLLTLALVAGAAWLVLGSRSVRRATWLLGRHAAGLGSAALARELHRAWRDSGPPAPRDAA